MGRGGTKLELKAPQTSCWLTVGLLVLDIFFGGGKLSHSPIITKSWERNYPIVILISPMVVVHKLNFSSETLGRLVKRYFWATLRVSDLIGLWWAWEWSFLTVSKGRWCCCCPSSLGDSLFDRINMGYQISFWVWRDMGETSQTKLTHCFADLSGFPCSAANRSRPGFCSLHVRHLPWHFAFLILIRCFLSIEALGVDVPKHRVYWREPDFSTVTFLPWEFTLISFMSWTLQGEDVARSFWEPVKALGTLRATLGAPPHPSCVLGKPLTESSVKVSIFSVAQWWRRIKGRHFILEKIVFCIEILALNLKQYCIWIIWGWLLLRHLHFPHVT